MRFLSLILLLSLPCTISIHAMESGTEKTDAAASTEIICLTEKDYSVKISAIHSFIRNKLNADVKNNTVSFSDYDNPCTINTTKLSEIKYELDLADRIKDEVIPGYFGDLIAIKNDIRTKPTTLEQKKKAVSDYFAHANKEIKYQVILQQLVYWLQDKDIRNTKLENAQKEIYKKNRLKLTSAVQDEDINAIDTLRHTIMNPSEPESFSEMFEDMIKVTHEQFDSEFNKPLKPMHKVKDPSEDIPDECKAS